MESQTFARNFFSIVTRNENETNNLTNHEEWLLREYAKLMKREAEVKKQEEFFNKQSNANQNSSK